MFDNIPQEMRNFPQWIVWRYEDTDSKKPTKVPYSPISGMLASVTDSATWSNFEQACNAAKSNWFSGIGFVLTENDPYAFIDLDDTKGDKEAHDRQLKIYSEFNSYAERSPSGNGLHIIIKGALESGRRRSSIEIYSSARYMTMTGDVFRNAPINDYNELLNVLWKQMGGGNAAAAFYAGVVDEKETDSIVIERATAAANGEKFAALNAGKWQDLYSSQSEADLSYINIVAFYTQNRAQIARIFRNSGLGQRDKAKRVDYVHWMLNKSFDNMLPPVDIDGLRNQLNAAIEAKSKKTNVVQLRQPMIEPKKNVYSVPPGLVGLCAQFIYKAAPRPVPEIALAGALGLIAGIVGRSYNVSGTGLNQYVLLLAPTGTGKEAIASGIDKLMAAVIKTVPAAAEFIGPGKIASEQALLKYMAKSATSMVSIVGEFGIQLKMMTSPFAPPHLQGLLSMMLDLYNKSGEGKVLRPSIYSNRDNNTAAVMSPAFTLIGESTPEKFYESLDESMIASGLLPRFTAIEYTGERPVLNTEHVNAQPSFDVIEMLSTLCAHSLMLNSQHKAIHVQCMPEAKKIFDAFDTHCDTQINTSEKEIKRHLWNRAHIKAMKLAGLVAVGCNPYDPTITEEHANWAIEIVVSDVRNLLGRFNSGEIGVDNEETKQLAKLVSTFKDYVVMPWKEVSLYAGKTMAHLHNEKIVPYSYLQRRLAAVAVFRKDRLGSTFALKRSLKTLVDSGDIQEISKATLAKDHGTTTVCFMIKNMESFGL